jgi:AAA domain
MLREGCSVIAPGDGDLLAGIRDGQWLDKQNFPPLRYAVPQLVPEGLSVLAGAPKVGKSWLVLGWLLAVAAGDGLALGGVQIPGARDVLYLALEDGDRRMQARCRTLLHNEYRPGDPIPHRFQYVTAVTPGTLIATIAAWLEVYQSGLVVVDTLGRALPPAMNGEAPYSRDYRIMSDLKAVADSWPGCSLLLNHHDRKAVTSDFVESVSGTNGIAGGADTVLVLTRDRNQSDGLLQVTGRDVSEGAYALTFDAGVWTLDGGDLEAAAKAAAARRAQISLGDRSRGIIEAVTSNDSPISPAEVAEELGISNDTAGKYLRRLAGTGRLAKAGRGLYTPLSEVSERPNEHDADSDNGHFGHHSEEETAVKLSSRPRPFRRPKPEPAPPQCRICMLVTDDLDKGICRDRAACESRQPTLPE